MFWWPVEVVVFIQMISLLLCFWPSAFFDPVTALESVISLRFRALLGVAKVCPLSGPATCHVLWCFWLLELRHPCPFGQDNNICHGYPMCFAQAEVGNTAGKKKKTCFYIFFIGFWLENHVDSDWFYWFWCRAWDVNKNIINIRCLLLKQMYVQNH